MNSKRTAIDLFPLLNEDAISAIASGMKPKDIGELAATHRLGKTACEKSVAERAKSIVAACERAKNKTTVFVAESFKHNLCIINAGTRKAKLIERSEHPKLVLKMLTESMHAPEGSERRKAFDGLANGFGNYHYYYNRCRVFERKLVRMDDWILAAAYGVDGGSFSDLEPVSDVEKDSEEESEPEEMESEEGWTSESESE
jgi:hypothetical protein|tara:strand:+ start:146 stop:745 length:600 start_codon:yes stop_codon:yes gene_type:complete